MKKILRNIFLITGLAIVFSACENEPVGPILGDESTFTNPALTNPVTSAPKELLPDNAADLLN
ncbi:MAG: hypothetical protein U5K79_02805 [Cyclobacteriaceae bacterium]|nr:hypothetical protein [Cyclobacteriaceae bacterium]